MPATRPDRIVKARHQHRCGLCGLRIRRGATYVLREGADGPAHWRLKMHPVCKAATRDWDDWDWEGIDCPHDFRRFSLELTPEGMRSLVAEIMRGAQCTSATS